MTQEEKQLLLKDLCSHLPYGVIVSIGNGKYRVDKKLWSGLFDDNDLWGAKPYLHPMSSMTEEEKIEWDAEYAYNINSYPYEQYLGKMIDWLLKHHFDYRGLIPMGLALEAPEDMYK